MQRVHRFGLIEFQTLGLHAIVRRLREEGFQFQPGNPQNLVQPYSVHRRGPHVVVRQWDEEDYAHGVLPLARYRERTLAELLPRRPEEDGDDAA